MNNYSQPEQLELPNIINQKLEDWQLKIGYDDCLESPRKDYNIGKILCLPNKYIKNELELPYEYNEKFEKSRNLHEIEEMLTKLGYIHERICVYDHSGVSIYLGTPCCRWDSGYIGWYVVDKKQYREDHKIKRISKKELKNIDEIMQSEIKTYNNWINGNVFWYELYKNGKVIDSCGGFIADSEEDAIKDIYESGYLDSDFTDSFTLEELLKMAKECN